MKDGFVKLQKPKRMRDEAFDLKQERKHQERARQEQRAQSRERKLSGE